MDLMHANSPVTPMAATQTSANYTLAGTTDANYIIFTNMDTFPYYIKLGSGAAAITDTPIPPLTQISYRKEVSEKKCSVIAPSGKTGTLLAQCGNAA